MEQVWRISWNKWSIEHPLPQNGTKGKGEFKDHLGSISLYGKYGNFTGKYVNGVKQ